MNIRNKGSVSGDKYRQWGEVDFGRAKPVAKKRSSFGQFIRSWEFAACVAVALATLIVLGQSHQRDKNDTQAVQMGNIFHVPVEK